MFVRVPGTKWEVVYHQVKDDEGQVHSSGMSLGRAVHLADKGFGCFRTHDGHLAFRESDQPGAGSFEVRQVMDARTQETKESSGSLNTTGILNARNLGRA